ncbi:MAG TPA: histidine kinase [Anaerolineae bacterium]|nr:histidine kinase [Anaerolineae bacterium]
MSNHNQQIAKLEAEIAELKARMPKHSVPTAMFIELEDLEDELEILKARVGRESD